MKLDNEIFKQNNTDKVKGNTTKLKYTNYGKNINAFLSFIQISDHSVNYCARLHV